MQYLQQHSSVQDNKLTTDMEDFILNVNDLIFQCQKLNYLIDTFPEEMKQNIDFIKNLPHLEALSVKLCAQLLQEGVQKSDLKDGMENFILNVNDLIFQCQKCIDFMDIIADKISFDKKYFTSNVLIVDTLSRELSEKLLKEDLKTLAPQSFNFLRGLRNANHELSEKTFEQELQKSTPQKLKFLEKLRTKGSNNQKHQR